KARDARDRKVGIAGVSRRIAESSCGSDATFEAAQSGPLCRSSVIPSRQPASRSRGPEFALVQTPHGYAVREKQRHNQSFPTDQMKATLYEALGIQPSSSDEEVRAALRRLIRKYYAKTRDGQG